MLRRFAPFGAALIMAGALWLILYGMALAQIEPGSPAPTRTPHTDPLPTAPPDATPTIDRLAAPPTAAVPNQADEGAQLFWLHCQPCHGDRGQGLTDEWRAQYPPEDQNCWNSGCHGVNPYDPAFVLPTSVPAVIGDGAGVELLQKFETMDSVYRYVSVAMPYFFPGDLSQEEYLAITAYIARENGLWDGAQLTTGNLANYRLRPAAAATSESGGHLSQAASEPTSAAVSAAPGSLARIGMMELSVLRLGALITLLAIGGFLLWRKRG